MSRCSWLPTGAAAALGWSEKGKKPEQLRTTQANENALYNALLIGGIITYGWQ